MYEKEFKGWNKDSRLQGLCVVSRDYFTKQRGGYVNDDVCVTLFHLSPNVVTLWSLLHLRPNVITFRSLLHLRPNVITFRSLLHLRSVITFRSSTDIYVLSEG